MKKILAIASATLLLAGCNSSHRGTKDSPVEQRIGSGPVGPLNPGQNNSPANLINFPDHFANIAFKCNGVDGLYVTTRPAPPVVVPNDPMCAK